VGVGSVASVDELGADQARKLVLRAQGLGSAPAVRVARSGPRARRNAVEAMLARLGAVQLDTISVLARSHELVAYARLGAVGRDAIEDAYWAHAAGDARVFEYWSHAACLLPAHEWPAFGFRRRANRARGHRWHDVDATSVTTVLERLRAEGPLTSGELGGGRKGGEWWDWTDVKIAVEWLLDVGEVVVSERRGWRRVYDLPERALPPSVLDGDLDDAACLHRLVSLAGRQLGVATEADLADQYRLRLRQVRSVVRDTDLVPVTVQGWPSPAWADPTALASLTGRTVARTTLLSPFDSLVWNRKRTARVFGMDHRLEAYTPAPKRIHGYFAMPVLHRGALVGRVDPGRVGTTLHARRVTLDVNGRGVVPAAALDGTAAALREAATWVGCTDVVVDEVAPAAMTTGLRARL
jgi:uncharacterized protein